MRKITSIGEILFDIYGTQKNFGGAPFNFVYHIHKISGKANFISAVGNDNDGNTILEFLKLHKFSLDYVSVNQGIPTGNVLVKLNKFKIPEYHIKSNVAYDYINLTGDQIIKILNDSSLIYFGTLCQRNSISRKSIQSFFNSDCIKFCDLNLRQTFYTQQIIADSLNASNILKLSADELSTVCKLLSVESSKMEDSVKYLMKRFNINFISVTMGEEGAALFSENDSVHHKEKPVAVLDTVGAGDAYAAILALGIVHNHHIDKINRLANQFASEICTIRGALPHDEKIYDFYREQLINEE